MNSEQKTKLCHRCKGYFVLRYMVPLVDDWNRWDGISYRDMCITCWEGRAGALPPSDPNFFMPRNMRTKRYDRMVMGIKQKSAERILRQASLPIVKDAFSEKHIPAEELMGELNKQPLPTASDILSRQHPSSKNEIPSGSHACEYDRKVRVNPQDNDICLQCGKTKEDIEREQG